MNLISQLHPVSFVWDMRDGGKKDVLEFGFIAQELQDAQSAAGVIVPGLVYGVNPERLEASAGTLIPVLVKAVQELAAKVAALEAQIKGA